MLRSPLRPLLTWLVLAPAALAQWSNDPSQNFALADGVADQSQPKLAATLDGGAWVSWFDGIASGWDVRVQKVDAAGFEVFAHGGLLVADRSLSSTQDYGLDVDAAGDALLAFRGSNGNEVRAAKVTAAGALPWGSPGVLLTNGSAVSPKITGTTDGGAVVVWGENGEVLVRKLDAGGALGWSATLTPTGGAFFPADVHATGTGAIVSLVHQTGGFSSPKHLLAQKYDGAGSAQWGATPVSVFDGGSLQFGNFPPFVPDGAGGGVFAWYTASPSLNCFAQRLDANGGELWPHNGLAVSGDATQARVSPHVEFDAAAGETFVAWKEINASQSQSGVSAQRIDAAGSRLWGPNGVALVPLGTTATDMVRIVPGGATGGACVVWERSPSFGADELLGAQVDAGGVPTTGPFTVASTPSGKGRLTSTALTGGGAFAALAWSDDRADEGDVYVQNLNFDGSLGRLVGATYCGPAVPNSTGYAGHVSGTGSLAAGDNDLVLTATLLPSGQFAYFLASETQGFVSTPPGSQGNLCLGGTIARFISQVGAVDGGRYEIIVDLTNIPLSPPVAVMPGETWNFQAWHRDKNPSATSNFTDAVSITFQ